jgi:ankyrin repeat protein
LSQFPFGARPAIIVVMTDETTTVTVPSDAPVAVELLLAVRGGDVDLVSRLLSENPDLARAKFEARGGTGTALHFVADWPGYFPNGPDIVHILIDAGADPNALTTGGGSATPGAGSETPLHYAASSDDVDVAAALIDGGADLETPDGSIGTPLDNAVGYACWHVARLLVMRGARVEKVWHASALGMLERLDALLLPEIDAEQISQGFWHACVAGQRRAAQRLLSVGADLNWEPEYAQGTALDAATGLGTRQDNVIEWLRSIGARSAQASE